LDGYNTFHFENGNIKAEYEQYYKYIRKGKITNYQKPPWYNFLDMARKISYQEDCIAFKGFYSNGQLKCQYDLRKDTLTIPIIKYNK